MPTIPGSVEKTGAGNSFKNATRVQVSFVTAAEKRALAWFAARMPAWVGSDHLTILGFAAQIMVGVSYALSRYNKIWLLWGILFLAVNWFGDSLDGTLARFRNRQRPRYGFYVDHVIDAIGSTALMVGLALSGVMTPIIALALLVAFLLLAIEVYLATYTIGSFHLSFFNLGPTEIRIILAIGNIALYVRGPWAHISGHAFLLFDGGAVVSIIVMNIMFLYAAIKHTAQLYREERLP
ncbi:MAG TPA: CDP-alcohol phosphatidyltransferase family protein [Terriglobales bacterium]|nr:CDP-alcohol phosphatidyltransferase family protein [Terriglobales bacterium]